MEKVLQRDSLSQMVSKFNAMVDELETLKKLSAEGDEAVNVTMTETLQTIQTNLQETLESVNTELTRVSNELTTQLNEGLQSVELADATRPVSTPQREAIEAAKQEAIEASSDKLTSEPAGTEVRGDDLAVAPEIKRYVEKMVLQALAGRDTGAQYRNGKLVLNTPNPGIIGYDKATELSLGVVKASDDVNVDSATGRMMVPKLSVLSQRIEQVNTTLTDSITNITKGVQIIAKNIGNIEALHTDTKQDLVSAINETFDK